MQKGAESAGAAFHAFNICSNAAAKAGGKSVHISASSGTAAAAAAAGAGTEEDESRQGGGNRPLRFFPFSQASFPPRKHSFLEHLCRELICGCWRRWCCC